jgi:amino-acid N-acetyltransferase
VDLYIRQANESDLPKIRDLLVIHGLPVEGVEQHINNFFAAVTYDVIVGTIGLEVYGIFGLLRSACVHPDYQNKGNGSKLYDKLIQHAKSLNMKEIYLLTTTAEKYFLRKGFTKIGRDAVAPEVKLSDEFTGACPASAVCMMLKLN